MSWIPKQKRYEDNATLYCDNCDEIVKVEFNPEWLEDGKPFEWENKEYKWFIRCCE